MQQTNLFKLNLIESGDTFSPNPLNENMELVEAALQAQAGSLGALSSGQLKCAVGTYIGNGKSGSENANSLTFSFEPKFLLIWTGADSYRAIGIRGGKLVIYYSEQFGELPTTWSGNTVSWYFTAYSGDGTRPQMNGNNMKYQYFALG